MEMNSQGGEYLDDRTARLWPSCSGETQKNVPEVHSAENTAVFLSQGCELCKRVKVGQEDKAQDPSWDVLLGEILVCGQKDR